MTPDAVETRRTVAAVRVSLESVTSVNRKACAALRVADDQARFVASNARSLSWADIDEACVPLAICAEGRLVGFALYTVDPEEGCWIHRFMIDRRFQRRGYGRAALALLVERLARLPGCAAILISAARRSPIRTRHGRHPDQAPNRMQLGGYVRACTMDSSHTK